MSKRSKKKQKNRQHRKPNNSKVKSIPTTVPTKEIDADEPEDKDIKTKPILSSEIETFIKHLDALSGSIPLTMAMAEATQKVADKAFSDLLEKHGTLVNEEENSKTFTLLHRYNSQAKPLQKNYEETTLAAKILPQNFVVAFISQYDAFIGRVVKCLFTMKPELLNATDKQISFTDLSTFGSIADATEHILEKETETLLRKSHYEQFVWLENKFNIKLRENLTIWPTFIELTQRRNLFVHCNGVISNQYLNICKQHKVPGITALKVGEKLTANPEYINQAYECLFEIGVKLAHVLWRKISPEDIENADQILILNTFDLLSYEYYELAKIMLDFAVKLPRHFDDESKRIFAINQAQAYKFSNDPQECKKILESYDWSASSDKFKICLYVLNDDFEKASQVMIKLGKNSDISKESYQNWPVFKKFRLSEFYNETYKKVFGESPTKVSKIKKQK